MTNTITKITYDWDDYKVWAEYTAGTWISITSNQISNTWVTSFNWNTWTVTYTAPVTSVNGSTWAVTVSAVPTVWTNGQVLTVVSWAAAWANASGWDVMVSSQAHNLLTTGMKIWCGTEGDYANLGTYDSNSLYLTVPWGATPVTPRTPWANTLLYLPLDSTNTVNDLSGNGYNMTNNGNVSFWTYGWVDCAYFWTTAPYWLKNTSANIISWDYTFLVWLNWDSSDSGTDFPRIFWWNNSWWLLWERRFELIHPVFLWTSAWVAYTSWWHLLAFTGNISTKSFTPYKDGVQLTGWTWNSATSYTWILIGANESNNSEPVDRFCGYMSAVIWENRQRTATEISDYFNLTKSNYWIS